MACVAHVKEIREEDFNALYPGKSPSNAQNTGAPRGYIRACQY